MFNFAFSSLHHFLIMDGHGIYVWPVYLVSILLITIGFQVTIRKLKALLKKIKDA